MNNWQPIETAPRDGTEFLGFSYSESYHVVSYGYTHDGIDHWFNGDVHIEITRWMPLPKPPKEF